MNCGFDRTVALGACLLAIIALASLPQPACAQSGPVMSRQQLEAVLEESSKALTGLAEARNRSIPSAEGKRDQLGHTYKDDLRQNVLQPDVQARLAALQTAAADNLRTGDLPGAQVNLSRLRTDLAAEIERFKAIVDYWIDASHRSPYGFGARNKMLRAHGIEPVPISKEAEELELRFKQQIESRDFTAAMQITRPQYLATTKRAKPEELQQILAELDGGKLSGVATATPTRKCVPAKETSHADAPLPRVREMPQSGDYYPKNLQRQGIGGSSTVFVIIDAMGCPERSLVMEPSDKPEVDAGVARLAVDGRYYPGESDGIAVRTVLSLHVNFTSSP